MPARPLLIFPEPAKVAKSRKFGGPPNLRLPSGEQQKRRLRPKIARLKRDFETRYAELRQDPAGVEPEQVLVLEVVGSIADFYRTVQRTEGLEWLGEWDADVAVDPDAFAIEGR